MNGDTGPSRIPLAGGYNTSSGSFDEELRELLRRRVRLVFIIGLVASLTVFIFNRLMGLEPLVGSPGLQLVLHLMHPASFGLGLLAVQFRDKTASQLQGLGYLTILFNILLLIPEIAILYPEREPFLPLALMLFVAAAFLPCDKAQPWLAGFAAIGVLISYWVVPGMIPSLAAYWETMGMADMGMEKSQFQRAWILVGTAMLGGVSIVVSKTLYRLQRTAHRAKRLGNYVIEKPLGKGGMGEVFVARHAMICRPTAVKVLSQNGGADQSSIARFEREVQLSASLTHPNTITIFDFGRTADSTFYYAMEFLEGLDLQSMVEKHGPMPAERVISLIAQVCGSLSEAHGAGIIHRDIKPSNIFVTQRGGLHDFVKVLDFGLARELQEPGTEELTKTGIVFGTPRYIAPEAAYGANKADARSDLYNLGGVAYWLLTGQHLFAGSSSLDLIIDHVKTVPAPPSEASELPIPAELDAIIMRLLEKEPDKRFQTARELRKALESVPIEAPWTQAQAREWWELHGPEPSGIQACEPHPIPDDELAIEVTPAAVAG